MYPVAYEADEGEIMKEIKKRVYEWNAIWMNNYGVRVCCNAERIEPPNHLVADKQAQQKKG